MMPEIVYDDLVESGEDRLMKYPGIKEDVYVPRFQPAPGIREEFGVSANHIMVTVRPPASDAHYHSNESDELFQLTVKHLCQNDRIRIVMLPRNKKQEEAVRQQWSDHFQAARIVIPSRVVDGLNLIWYSDLVISGGGTMNREAAALGVPVYSIFRGKFGAIDRYLCSRQRMVSIASQQDLLAIPLVRREPPKTTGSGNHQALSTIVKNIISTVEMECHPN
jgi:predicted glycosyltransferase